MREIIPISRGQLIRAWTQENDCGLDWVAWIAFITGSTMFLVWLLP